MYLYSMKFTGNWGAHYEGWPAGTPEIDVRVFAPTAVSNFNSLGEVRFIDNLEPRKRNDIGEKWWVCNQSVLYWDKNVYTQTLIFDFTEDDDQVFVQLEEVNVGGSFKVSDSLTLNLSIKFSIKTMDEHIGKLTVDQCATPPRSDDGYYDVNQYFYFELVN